MTTRRARRKQPEGQSPKLSGRKALIRAVLELPCDPRDVFLLHRMARLTYEEIGARLNMGPDAVQTNLAEALVLLGQALAGKGSD